MASAVYDNGGFLRSNPSTRRSVARKPTHRDTIRASNASSSTGEMTPDSRSISGFSDGTAATSMSQVQQVAYSKKFVVVGDGGCGKTCLLMSYAQGVFPEKYVPTVFENYITQKPYHKTGQTVELALWDTAGQEEYDRLRPLSYPETDLIFVCFAIDCPNSFDNIFDKWFPEVQHFCPTTPLILVGLKSDLRYKKTCVELLRTQGLTPVTPEMGKQLATQMSARYMECSSKDGIGVHDVFNAAIETVISEEVAARERSRTSQTSGGGSSGGAGKRKKRSCKIL